MHIVCPLAYERRALQRAAVPGILPEPPCGPGARAVARWAERFERDHGDDVRMHRRPVVLAGLAGALDERLSVGQAVWVEHVRADDGGWLHPSFPDAGSTDRDEEPATRICASPNIVRTPRERLELARQTGCCLVDQESAAFAKAAAQFGWRWGILRGISDGVDDPLPNGIEHWVDEAGRSRVGRVMWDLLRRPGDIPTVGRLSRAGRLAMRAVAARLAEIKRAAN